MRASTGADREYLLKVLDPDSDQHFPLNEALGPWILSRLFRSLFPSQVICHLVNQDVLISRDPTSACCLPQSKSPILGVWCLERPASHDIGDTSLCVGGNKQHEIHALRRFLGGISSHMLPVIRDVQNAVVATTVLAVSSPILHS